MNTRICSCCMEEAEREMMDYTKDCQGITYRLVCLNCWNKLMAKGYDGEKYIDTGIDGLSYVMD